MTQERWIPIPDEVNQILRQWRPSPLHRARRLEEFLETPAKIYYKNEGVSPAGSHKPNTAIPQAYYNKRAGIQKLTTETGAGQWGSSISLAGAMFGLDVKVYMVRISFQQKPYRKALMETYGAEVVPSPSDQTEVGREIIENTSEDNPGSLGIAISEACEEAAADESCKYSLGSVLNHVMLHQTVIGLEAMDQLESAGAGSPDVVVGCAGGGSNFAGIAFPFVGQKLRGELSSDLEVIAVEPKACPTLTRGKLAYDFGDTSELTPLMRMHTLGSKFVPASIHAGGLRYHGMSPMVSHLVELGLVTPQAYTQLDCFSAGMTFAKVEGIVPAPESNHAVRAAIDQALQCKEKNEEKTILFCLSGHGHFDMQAYSDFNAGLLTDGEYSQEEIENALSSLPLV